jgi:dolichol-phosphate mannosyltransferase
MKRISVAVPVMNEEAVIPEFLRRLNLVFEKGEYALHEVVFVDDGSRDHTLEVLKGFAKKDQRIKVLSLSRNFGHQVALTAALDEITGDAVIAIDGDLQDPPEAIPKLLDRWKEGFEVVYAVRESRDGETWFKKITATLYYRILRSLSEVTIPLDTGDFALMDRKVVDVLKQMPEHSRFIRGMRAWAGFRAGSVLYKRQSRYAGSSKYPLRKMIDFALTGLLGFSTVPLRFATYIGIFMAISSFLAGILVIFIKLFTEYPIEGWSSIMLSIFFVGGVQLCIIGIMGEYIGRIYTEVRGRPLYIVKEKIGFIKKSGHTKVVD